MRFLAGANVSRLVILRLRAAGHDVISVSETFPPRTPDEQVLSAAQASDSILITEDRDFGELVIRQKVVGPGCDVVGVRSLIQRGRGRSSC